MGWVYVPIEFMNLIASLTVAERLALTLGGLCRAVAARIAGGALAAAVIVVIWGRIKRAEVRFQGMLTRFLAGRLRVRARVAVAGARAERPAVVRSRGGLTLPRRL